MLQVLAFPAETVAQAFDGYAQCFKHAVFTKARTGHFHELVDLDRFGTAMGAQRQAKGCRAFALAVAGVDDHDAAPFTLGFGIGFGGGWSFNLHGESSG